MGSIISFIVLNVANVSVIRASYEFQHGKKVALTELPAVVNGDDGLVLSEKGFMPIWESVAASAGLMPSVGKTYEHDYYSNINSTSFLLNEERSYFELITYVNMGLVKGLKRSGGKSSIREVCAPDPFLGEGGDTLGARHHDLIESCPEELRDNVHKMFISENYHVLKAVRVPWYVPTKFGGVGLRPLTDEFGGYKTVASHRCGPSPVEEDLVFQMKHGLLHGRVKDLPNDTPVMTRSVWSEIVGSGVRMNKEYEGLFDLLCYYFMPGKLLESGFRQKAQEKCKKLGIVCFNSKDETTKSEPFAPDALRRALLRRNELSWSRILKLPHRLSVRTFDLD